MGLFLGDGLVIDLSRCFGSPWIPRGIGVKNQGLEIAGLDSGIGLGSEFLDSIIVEPGKQTRWVLGSKICNGEAGKDVIGEKGFFVIEREPLTQISYENITQALNGLKHEVLSHQLFL